MIFFNLDKNSGLSINAIKNKIIIKKIRKAYREFKRDGASHVFTTYIIILGIEGTSTINAVMDDSRAYLITSMLSQGAKYTAIIKFIKIRENDQGDYIYTIENHLLPIAINKKTVIFSKNMDPRIITTIGNGYYNIAYPVTVMIFGLYKINTNLNPARLTPMRTSTLNCVAERVMEHFLNSARGNKLTVQRPLNNNQLGRKCSGKRSYNRRCKKIRIVVEISDICGNNYRRNITLE
jgi:hypothetical protein